MTFQEGLDFACQLDRQDPLAGFREKFRIPLHDGREQVYFLGNSLGLPPRSAESSVQKVLDQWAANGVESFFEGADPWLSLHSRLQPPVAKLLGALPAEVVLMNQLTVNLHLMLTSFYRPQGRRKKILLEAKAFPSDQYMLHSHVAARGLDPEDVLLECAPRAGEELIRTEDIVRQIAEHKGELALVFWGGLNYYTGQVFDMEAICRAAREAGIPVGFDLAHAAGNVSLDLHRWGADFACWCNYKYLNGGPGAMAGAFIHGKWHRDLSLPRLAGWWGNRPETRFRMEKDFDPSPSAEGWQLSTPSILQYALLESSYQLFEEAGFDRLLEKSRTMSAYLFWLLEQLAARRGATRFDILTPRDPAARGCQLSLRFTGRGLAVFEELKRRGFMVDWREPAVIRLAPVPLYNRYAEIWQFTEALEQILSADA